MTQEADADRRARVEAMRRAKLAEHRRASSLMDGVREAPPSERVLDLYREAERLRGVAAKLRERDAKGNRGGIAAHEQRARQLEIEAKTRHEADREQGWIARAIAETARQAAARGEEIESETVELVTFVTGANGERLRHKTGSRRGEPVVQIDRVTRAVNRTAAHGLAQAFEKGWLAGGKGTPPAAVLFEIGLRYSTAFEALDPLRSAFGQEGGGGFSPKAPQVRVVEAGETLAILRRGLGERERGLMDAICGQGAHLRSITSTRNGFPAAQRRFRRALAQALDNWTAARKAGEVGVAARSVLAGNRALYVIRDEV